eukprot:gene18779-31413_t
MTCSGGGPPLPLLPAAPEGWAGLTVAVDLDGTLRPPEAEMAGISSDGTLCGAAAGGAAAPQRAHVDALSAPPPALCSCVVWTASDGPRREAEGFAV